MAVETIITLATTYTKALLWGQEQRQNEFASTFKGQTKPNLYHLGHSLPFSFCATWSNSSKGWIPKDNYVYVLTVSFLLSVARLSTLADQGPESPVVTLSLDTHWLSIRVSVSCDPPHRDFKDLLTESVISTWLVTVLFKDNVTLKHWRTAECLQFVQDKWTQFQTV